MTTTQHNVKAKTAPKARTQKDILVEAFNTAENFTTRQIASRLKVSESRARFLITELRQAGYAIYRNRKTVNGTPRQVYRLGTPSRKMVAVAAIFGGSELFS